MKLYFELKILFSNTKKRSEWRNENSACGKICHFGNLPLLYRRQILCILEYKKRTLDMTNNVILIHLYDAMRHLKMVWALQR